MEIDEFSLKLGSLEAGHRSLSNQQNIMDNKLDRILDKLTLINGSVGKAHSRIDDIIPDVESSFANSNDWIDTKKKAKWIIGLTTVGGAASGFSFSKFFAGLLT